MNTKNCILFILILIMGMVNQGVYATGYHIPTVSEGLLDSDGYYIGAYLGGNQGANNAMCVNYYKKYQDAPYETQISDHPLEYIEKNPMIFMETSADGNGISGDELSLKKTQ